jgi:sialate O-acetylesterase
VPIGLIPCAFGGTSLRDWDPAGAGQGENSLYGFMLERVKLAGGKVRGMLWYQGESEATENCLVEPNYTVRQRRLIEAVRRDLQAPQLPFLQAQIASFIGYEWKFAKKGMLDRPYEIIREFQRELAEEMEHVYTVATVDLDHWDLIHLSAAAQAQLGERFAYLALPYSKAGVAPRQEIRLKSVRFANTQRNQIAVEFTGVTGRLRAAGNPYGFEIFDPASGEYRDWVFRIDFDKANPARLLLNFDFGITLPLDTRLYYAPHAFKYVNVLDENDMSLPAFGPAKIEPFVAQP